MKNLFVQAIGAKNDFPKIRVYFIRDPKTAVIFPATIIDEMKSDNSVYMIEDGQTGEIVFENPNIIFFDKVEIINGYKIIKTYVTVR